MGGNKARQLEFYFGEAIDQGADTVIIPGHGPVSNRAELIAYRDMLVAARDGIMPLIADGKSVEDVIAAKPTATLDAKWGGGFLNPERFVCIVYNSLKK